MKAYFDNLEKTNLSNLSSHEGNPWLTFNNKDVFEYLKNAGFGISDTADIKTNGIYFVSVRNYSDYWSGKHEYGPPRHVLYEIPAKIINAARRKKVVIVIDNSSEGFSLIYKNVDGFKEMHDAMTNLSLPKYSVLLVDNNMFLKDEYEHWCIENKTEPQFAHVDFLTGFYYFQNGRNPSEPLLIESLRNLEVKSFNSLNRTCRAHRLDHLYYLIEKGWHKKGIVSGHYTNFKKNTHVPSSLILRVEQEKFEKVLKSACPLIADDDFIERNPDHSDFHIFNHDIYKKSLLSVVTETAFQQYGMFITEKSFKPIVAGHPFMILGQYGILKKLKEMGYKTNFPGLDYRYDDIRNPTERFKAFHKSLQHWIELDHSKKLELMVKAIPMVKHNKYVYNSHDYNHESYKKLYKVVEKIFLKKYNK